MSRIDITYAFFVPIFLRIDKCILKSLIFFFYLLLFFALFTVLGANSSAVFSNNFSVLMDWLKAGSHLGGAGAGNKARVVFSILLRLVPIF
jgi:hypothetical protein